MKFKFRKRNPAVLKDTWLAHWRGNACSALTCARRPPWRYWLYSRSNGVQLEKNWYCSPQCFESAMQNLLSRLKSSSPHHRVHHRIPLGLLMLSRGLISESQLKLALAAQQASGRGKFGSWLLQLGFSTEPQVMAALGRQWSCPVVSDSISLQCACLALLPLPLEESFGMVPLHYIESTGLLHIAFAEEIDYTILFAIQQSLGYRTVPCLGTSSLIREALEKARSVPRPSELVFETCKDKSEISRITANYVSRSRATHVRVVHCAGYLWVHLECRTMPINLLFHTARDWGSELALQA